MARLRPYGYQMEYEGMSEEKKLMRQTYKKSFAEARCTRRMPSENESDGDPDHDVIYLSTVIGVQSKETISNEQMIVDRKRKLENSPSPFQEEMQLRKQQKVKNDAEAHGIREEQERELLALGEVAAAADKSHEVARQALMAKQASLQELEETRAVERLMFEQMRDNNHDDRSRCNDIIEEVEERMQEASNEEFATHKKYRDTLYTQIEELQKSLREAVSNEESKEAILLVEQQSVEKAKDDEDAKRMERLKAGKDLANHP